MTNIPTAIVVCRHIFEWAAQVCYMNENLGKYVAARDWDAARDLLNQAVIGGKAHWGMNIGMSALTCGA